MFLYFIKRRFAVTRPLLHEARCHVTMYDAWRAFAFIFELQKFCYKFLIGNYSLIYDWWWLQLWQFSCSAPFIQLFQLVFFYSSVCIMCVSWLLDVWYVDIASLSSVCLCMAMKTFSHYVGESHFECDQNHYLTAYINRNAITSTQFPAIINIRNHQLSKSAFIGLLFPLIYAFFCCLSLATLLAHVVEKMSLTPSPVNWISVLRWPNFLLYAAHSEKCTRIKTKKTYIHSSYPIKS